MAPEIDHPENSYHPPRWADALLRSVLTPENAEATSGDLIEAYRDSIRPHRGRWQSDFWYLRQVAGCMLRAKTPMNLRNWLLAGLTLASLMLVFSVLIFPNPNPSSVPFETRIFVGAIVAFLFYAYAAIWRTRAGTPEDELVLRLGAKWGIAIGLAWIGLYASLGRGFVPGLLLLPAAFLCSFICGAHGAGRTWRARNGMRVGFWSGLVSGLIAFLLRLSVAYRAAFNPGHPNPDWVRDTHIPHRGFYTAAEYQHLHILDGIGGALTHLFLIGGLVCTVAGLVTGCAYVLLARTGLTPEEKTRLPHWF